MVSDHLFHYRKNSWPPEEYVGRSALQLVRRVCVSICPSRHAGAADPNPAPLPSPASAAPMPQQPKGEEAVLTSEVVVDETVEDMEVQEGITVAGCEGEALRSFLGEFGDQEDDCLIPSPRLKEIRTPDRPAVF